MQTAHSPARNIFGLYELSGDGLVLYSRERHEDASLTAPNSHYIGKDLFRDVMPFRNNDDLRRHFRRFITGQRPVDTFLFDCFLESEVVRTKIFMTRARESNG